MRRRREHGLVARAAYALDRFLGASAPRQLLVMSATGFAIAGAFGALAWALFSGQDDLSAASKGFWWALNRMLDGGNVNSDTGLLRRALGVSATMTGIVFVGWLTGAFASIFSARLDDLRKGRAEVVERGHVVLLGWNSRAGVVVRELAATGRRLTVVVLAERARADIESELVERLDREGGRRRLRWIVRTGDPTRADVVRRVAPGRARVALVLPEAAFEEGEAADRWALRATLALRRAAHRRPKGLGPLPVVVEVPDDEGRALLGLVGGEGETSVVASREAIAGLLVQSVRQPRIFEVLHAILSLRSSSLHFHDAPAATVGRTFGEAHAAITNAVLVGVVPPDPGARPRLAPSGATPIVAGTQLVVLADLDEPLALGGSLPAPQPSAVAHAAPSLTRALLVVGHKPSFADLVGRLAAQVDGLAQMTLLVDARDEAAARAAASAHASDALAIEVEVGDTCSPAVLDRALAARSFDTALLLADHVPTADVERADADQIVRLLAARRARASRGAGPRLVVEVRSPNTRRLVGPVHTAGDFVVSREIVGMLLAQEVLASVGSGSHGAGWMHEASLDLFDARGAELAVVPAADLAPGAASVTFAALLAQARARGAVALGWIEKGHAPTLAPARDASLAVRPGALVVLLVPCPVGRDGVAPAG